jgi:multiple sugar transport system ATP-binding protein
VASVTLQGIRKVFRGLLRETVAVEDLSLEVREGEFVTLVGPSGCGKSTTLRMIAGLEMPTRGDIYFDAERMTEVAPQERNVSMVFQNYAIFPHFTAGDNIGYHLRVRGVPRAERQARVADVARLLKIEHLLDRKPRELSGGERQRVALGRAIIRHPRVFLLDEPLSNLDAKFRDQMRVEIRRLQLALRTTAIYVTHDQLEAMTMSDRIAVMNQGRLHQFDTPSQVFREPADRFVAEFIGSPSMNFLPARLEDDGGTPVLCGSGFSVPVRAERRQVLLNAAAGGAVELGIRPHAVVLQPKPKAFGASVAAEVLLLEPVGATTHVHLRVGDATVIAVTDASFSAAIGEAIELAFPAPEVYLFDRESGRTLVHGL